MFFIFKYKYLDFSSFFFFPSWEGGHYSIFSWLIFIMIKKLVNFIVIIISKQEKMQKTNFTVEESQWAEKYSHSTYNYSIVTWVFIGQVTILHCIHIMCLHLMWTAMNLYTYSIYWRFLHYWLLVLLLTSIILAQIFFFWAKISWVSVCKDSKIIWLLSWKKKTHWKLLENRNGRE